MEDIASYYQFRKNVKRWETSITEEESTLFETLKEELQIKDNIYLIKSKKVTTPWIIGYVKPIVILADYEYDEVIISE